MAKLSPHYNFNGNAEEAFNFYRSVFGGEFTKIIRFKDLVNEYFTVPDHELEKIMQICLPVGDGVLMGNDVPEAMGKTNEKENRSKIYISANSAEEAVNLFEGLSIGGEIEMPLEEGPTGSSFAMLRDKYGIEWMIEFDPNMEY